MTCLILIILIRTNSRSDTSRISPDTEAPVTDLDLSITYDSVSTKIYDKQDDFNFDIVNCPVLVRDVPRSPFYGVYISQLICFARLYSNVDEFNNIN